MAKFFGIADPKTGISAAAGSRTLLIDPVTEACAALGKDTTVMAFLRANAIADPTVNFNDRLGNVITASGASGAVKTAVDANFNNRASINLNGVTLSCYQTQGALGLNGFVGTPPADFTVVGVINPTSLTNPSNFFGTTDLFSAFFDGTGELKVSTKFGTDTQRTSAALISAGQTAIVWFSHDSVNKVTRVGKNNTTATALTAHTTTYVPTAGAKVNPFGFTALGSGRPFTGRFGMYAMFNKAYMTGASPTDDDLFTAFIAACKSYWGL